jgi:hypothetical protein
MERIATPGRLSEFDYCSRDIDNLERRRADLLREIQELEVQRESAQLLNKQVEAPTPAPRRFIPSSKSINFGSYGDFSPPVQFTRIDAIYANQSTRAAVIPSSSPQVNDLRATEFTGNTQYIESVYLSSRRADETSNNNNLPADSCFDTRTSTVKQQCYSVPPFIVKPTIKILSFSGRHDINTTFQFITEFERYARAQRCIPDDVMQRDRT